ncbi:ribbon-helix-helix protein, CopG family [Alkalinema pantanalense CENA528]|uniref:ribbon-helix-helix protein, CopG family n=1 Tax=Alkalinema pantanalense TaxID=1620705 RepID=UPI003D6DD895
MPSLKLAATKIPEDWDEKLNRLTQETGLTRAEILRNAIGQYLGMLTDNPVNDALTVTEKLQALTDRVDALEAKLSDRLTTVNRASRPSRSKVARDTDKGMTVDHPERTGDTRDTERANSSQCPKCGSTDTAEWGKGKLRGDGTRGQKIKCNSCGKFSIVS